MLATMLKTHVKTMMLWIMCHEPGDKFCSKLMHVKVCCEDLLTDSIFDSSDVRQPMDYSVSDLRDEFANFPTFL